MRKPLLGEVAVARGLAIIAVLFIHGTSRPVTELDPASPVSWFYVVLNRGTQFAVPLFFLISALVLTYQLGDRDRVDWRDFYVKRLRQVVVPYLVWTSLYAAVRLLFLETGDFAWTRVASWFLTGKAWFHLYFLVVLIEFYALYPLVWRLWRALSVGSRPAFGLTLAVLVALQLVLWWVDRTWIRPVYPYSTVLNYVVPLGLGLWLGSHAEGWGAWWRAARYPMAAGAVAAGVVYVGLNVPPVARWATTALAPLGRFMPLALQVALWLFVSLAAVTVVLGAQALARSRAGAWLARLGDLSFGIYLIHPAFLTVWERLVRPESPIAYHLSVAGGLAVMLAGSWAATWLIGRTPLRHLLLGNR